MIFVQTKAFVKDLSKAKMSDKHFTKFISYLHVLTTQQTLPAEAKEITASLATGMTLESFISVVIG